MVKKPLMVKHSSSFNAQDDPLEQKPAHSHAWKNDKDILFLPRESLKSAADER